MPTPDKDLAFECRGCQYALEDEEGLPVWSGEDLAAWLITNCKQSS